MSVLSKDCVDSYINRASEVMGLVPLKETESKRIYKQYERECFNYKKQCKNSIFTNRINELDKFEHTMCLTLAILKKVKIKDISLFTMYTALYMYEEPFYLYPTDLGYSIEVLEKVDYDSYFLFHDEEYYSLYQSFLDYKEYSKEEDYRGLLDNYPRLDLLYSRVVKSANKEKKKILEKK